MKNHEKQQYIIEGIRCLTEMLYQENQYTSSEHKLINRIGLSPNQQTEVKDKLMEYVKQLNPNFS